jgi:hypothetical protein
MKSKSKDIVWHIYHTILAVELGAIVVIESIELIITLNQY